MEIISLIIVALIAGIIGYLIGRSSKNSYIEGLHSDMAGLKGEVSDAKSRATKAKEKASKMSTRYEEVLKERNDLTSQLEDKERLHAELQGEHQDFIKQHKVVVGELEETRSAWEMKAESWNTERQGMEDALKNEAAKWEEDLKLAQQDFAEAKSKVREKNGRIDELNALLENRMVKWEKTEKKLKAEIAGFSRQQKSRGKKSDRGKKAPKEAVPVSPKTAEKSNDDLTKVEGIGPKIAGLLQVDGIQSFADLAASTPEKIKGILDAAGPRYQVHDPGSWPKQADMAANGRWEELEKWQDEHKGGRE